jgi:hypothetical protein
MTRKIMLIMTVLLITFSLHAQNVSPEQQPGINSTLTMRLLAELRTGYYRDSIKVMTSLPTENDMDNFIAAKSLMDLGNTGRMNMNKTDSVFSAHLKGTCITRIVSQREFIYQNQGKVLEDMLWFYKNGIRNVGGIVYKYRAIDKVLVCIYEKQSR